MKIVLQLILLLFPVLANCQNQDTLKNKTINCAHIYFIENGTEKSDTIRITIPIEELTQIPPPSETLVNYITDYTTENDSLGRVKKLIRTNYLQGTVEETTYVYDENNRLIREDILMDNRNSGKEHYSYRNEQVTYTYSPNGNRTEKIRTVVYSPTNLFVIEKWLYFY